MCVLGLLGIEASRQSPELAILGRVAKTDARQGKVARIELM